MSRAVLTAAVILCTFPSLAQPADPETSRITGEYEGDGVDIKGQKYRTRVTITTEGDAYRVAWKTPDGQEFVGVGVRDGRKLSVGWAGQAPKGVLLGVMVYEAGKDRKLSGKWTMLGAKGVVRTEELTPAPAEKP